MFSEFMYLNISGSKVNKICWAKELSKGYVGYNRIFPS